MMIVVVKTMTKIVMKRKEDRIKSFSGVPYLVMWFVALGGSFTVDKLIGEIFAENWESIQKRIHHPAVFKQNLVLEHLPISKCNSVLSNICQ